MSTRRRDAVLALVALGGYLVLLGWTNTSLSPQWLLVGGTAGLSVEILASRYRSRVRRIWESPVVQIVALVATLAVGVAAAIAASEVALNLVVGGLFAYLALLALVSAGVLSPPHAWFDRPNERVD